MVLDVWLLTRDNWYVEGISERNGKEDSNSTNVGIYLNTD